MCFWLFPRTAIIDGGEAPDDETPSGPPDDETPGGGPPDDETTGGAVLTKQLICYMFYIEKQYVKHLSGYTFI